MTKLRISGVIGLSIACVAVSLLYAFFQPHIPGAVRSAVPAQATFIHEAESLDALLSSPICGQLDKALGAGNTLAALATSCKWIRRAVPAEIAVADLPLNYTGQPRAWATVSWVGWRSPWLRWKLEHTRAEGFSLIGKHHVWPVWKYESPDIARGSTLVFTLTDNLFIACLSNNPSDIQTLLNAYDNPTLSIDHDQPRIAP